MKIIYKIVLITIYNRNIYFYYKTKNKIIKFKKYKF
jgi:hypothetical protein